MSHLGLSESELDQNAPLDQCPLCVSINVDTKRNLNRLGPSKTNPHHTAHPKIFNKLLNSKRSSLPEPDKYIEKVFIRRYSSAKINSYIFFSKTLENRNRKKIKASTI